MTSIDSRGILSQLRDYAQSTGVFASVLLHEPKSAPQLQGAVTLSLWSGNLTAVGSLSGLNSVSMRWDVQGRIYTSAFMEPADDLDPVIVDATMAFMLALMADFELSSKVRNVDALGETGEPLRAQPGYYSQDSKIFRCMELFIPLIINDVLPEVP